MRDSDQLDGLLDEGLKAYVCQEPPAGFERRLMRSMSPVAHWWRFGIPAAAVFATVCFVMLTPRKAPPPKPSAPEYRAAERIAPVPGRPGRRRLKAESTTVPNRELALLHFAQTYPEALAALSHDDAVPIEISSLTIAPLTVDDLTTEELTQ